METANKEVSFRERKQQALSAEGPSETNTPPVVEEAPERTPSDSMESAQDEQGNDQLADTEYEEETAGALDDDPEGTLASGTEEESEEGVDWKKRYGDLRSEHDRSTANRKEMDQEHAQSMGDNLKLKFDLEDNLSEAKQMSQFMLNTMTGNANQFRNINWSQVPPEKIQEVQAQAQNAFMLEQQACDAYAQIKTKADQTSEMLRQRDAEIAITRLRRTIPGWSDREQNVYGNLHDFAVQSGMASDKFKEITDPVVMEWANAAMQMQNASKTVTTQHKRKQQAPRGRNAAAQPRDTKGKYRQADKAYQKAPSRQSFREKTLAKLNTEH